MIPAGPAYDAVLLRALRHDRERLNRRQLCRKYGLKMTRLHRLLTEMVEPPPISHGAPVTESELPECGAAKNCERADCPRLPNGNPDFTVGFGLAGGGYGLYEWCTVCGDIVSKTQVED